jgi:H+/Cl- antiporter ClcA
MTQHKHVYVAGIITGALCGILGSYTAYAVMKSALVNSTNGSASLPFLTVVFMALGGMVVGLVVSFIVHQLNK